MEATIDPERARGHTVASNAAADEAGAERIMRERQTGRSFVNYGYSENQVRSSFFLIFDVFVPWRRSHRRWCSNTLSTQCIDFQRARARARMPTFDLQVGQDQRVRIEMMLRANGLQVRARLSLPDSSRFRLNPLRC